MTESERAEISRQNGAKSKGPKTAEGKARSAQNSFKHGLYAEAIVLPHEEPEEFNQLQASFHARFQPIDTVEVTLVDRMAASTWRLSRAYCIETGALAFGLLDTELELEKDYDLLTSVDRITKAYQHATAKCHLPAIERAITRIQREFKNALDQLLELRTKFPAPVQPSRPSAQPEPEPVQDGNEPENPPQSQPTDRATAETAARKSPIRPSKIATTPGFRPFFVFREVTNR